MISIAGKTISPQCEQRNFIKEYIDKMNIIKTWLQHCKNTSKRMKRLASFGENFCKGYILKKDYYLKYKKTSLTT